jgi:hypothetical protein
LPLKDFVHVDDLISWRDSGAQIACDSQICGGDDEIVDLLGMRLRGRNHVISVMFEKNLFFPRSSVCRNIFQTWMAIALVMLRDSVFHMTWSRSAQFVRMLR